MALRRALAVAQRGDVSAGDVGAQGFETAGRVSPGLLLAAEEGKGS